jgi:dethiobiotin synthetase
MPEQRRRGFFITGTDTEVGKTYVTCALMQMLAEKGLRVGGMKPVSSGGAWFDGQWRNEDAWSLMQSGTVRLPYASINPYAFEMPISPHLAAENVGRVVDEAVIYSAFERISAEVDCLLVEGAGGWLTPLRQDFAIADLALGLGLPVVLVVGLKLGCISHARLTDRLIRESGVAYAGWVANCMDPGFTMSAETEASLAHYLGAEPLGRLGFSGRGADFDVGQNNHWNCVEILRQLTP